jgi:hypothetical protein
MATVSMSDLKKPATQTTVVESDSGPSTALTTPENAAAARGHAHNRAVKPPTLALGHSIGELGATFGVGNFVLDKALSLGNEIEVILLAHPQICLVEDAEYGGDSLPDIVYAKSVNPADIAAAEEIVLQRGGVLRREDSDDGHPHYRMGANVIVLIKAPEGTSEDELGLFPYRVAGHDYAAALWYIRKSAYKSAVASGFGRSALWLKDKPYAATWRVRTKMETWKKNTYPVPTATLIGKIDGAKDEASASLLAELEELAKTFASPAEG